MSTHNLCLTQEIRKMLIPFWQKNKQKKTQKNKTAISGAMVLLRMSALDNWDI